LHSSCTHLALICKPLFALCSATEAHYTEKLEIGYRWYDAHDVKPAFCFGHGLSYTNFTYRMIDISSTSVMVEVMNSGTKHSGAEVAQLYLGFPAAAGEPPKQLKGFHKTEVLAPGAKTTITFVLADRDMSIWDTSAHDWSIVEGEFTVHVGSSSRDIRLTGSFFV
jgi:beta-glucosidase